MQDRPRGMPGCLPSAAGEGDSFFLKVCTLLLNIASVQTLFLVCILSAFFSRSPVGFQQQTPQLGVPGFLSFPSEEGCAGDGELMWCTSMAPCATCSPGRLLQDRRYSS